MRKSKRATPQGRINAPRISLRELDGREDREEGTDEQKGRNGGEKKRRERVPFPANVMTPICDAAMALDSKAHHGLPSLPPVTAAAIEKNKDEQKEEEEKDRGGKKEKKEEGGSPGQSKAIDA